MAVPTDLGTVNTLLGGGLIEDIDLEETGINGGANVQESSMSSEEQMKSLFSSFGMAEEDAQAIDASNQTSQEVPTLTTEEEEPEVESDLGAWEYAIRKGESGDAGYDAVYGLARGVPENFKPTDMTVGEVLKAQQAMIKAGTKSTAVGKYQLIKETLQEAVNKLGIDPNEQFTPELQDRVAIDYLLKVKRTKVKDYLEAENPTREQEEAALIDLAKEWASFPVPSTGRSYYAGDGLNKAHISVEEAKEALRSLRNLKIK
jgi:muramidase (phage lysozyme)